MYPQPRKDLNMADDARPTTAHRKGKGTKTICKLTHAQSYRLTGSTSSG
jgi:hypothetical protein